MDATSQSSDSRGTQSTLLERVRNPLDADAWSEFVALYEPLLLKYVLARGLHEHDARDLVQNLFVKLMRELPRFDLDRQQGRFRTWLYRVTYNEVVDWARARRRHAQEVLANDLDDYARQIEAAIESSSQEEFDREHKLRVLQFVTERIRSQTQPKTWECFELHVIRGRPAKEIGAELGLNANNVFVNASRVLSKVREQCELYLESLDDEGACLSAG